MKRSNISDPNSLIGKNLAIHPAAPVTAMFDEPLYSWKGGICGSYSEEFAKDENASYFMEPGSVGPALIGSIIPGFGRAHRDIMAKFLHLASSNSIIHDKGIGTVSYDASTHRAVIDYKLDDETAKLAKDSIKNMARAWFAAGAKAVMTPFTKPLVLESLEDLDKVDLMSTEPNDLMLVSYHPQSTVRMGGDEQNSIINSQGECHHTKGLYVVDASTFPTSVHVNPQISVMSIAMHFAKQLINKI